MDIWIDDEDIWVARAAILHQLRYQNALDQERLFNYVEKRSADTQFFIREALGWALRNYGRVAPDAVRDFVAQHEDVLSGLTRREALKYLNWTDSSGLQRWPGHWFVQHADHRWNRILTENLTSMAVRSASTTEAVGAATAAVLVATGGVVLHRRALAATLPPGCAFGHSRWRYRPARLGDPHLRGDVDFHV